VADCEVVVALERFRLVVERLEDREELRDRQEVGNALRQVDQLELAALAAHRGVGTDDFAQACAVDVRHVAEIQQHLLVALEDQRVDLVLQSLITLAAGDFALQVEDHHRPDGALFDLHCQTP
jgi:hypothetical protein